MTIIESTTTAHTLGVPRLLAGVDGPVPVDLARHRVIHPSPPPRSRAWLTAALRDVNLLGRGGAAFPVVTKLEAVPAGAKISVLVNGSESEPASRKDRALMCTVPHLVIDGALVVAHALGADTVTITIHDATAHDAMSAAVRERRDDVRVVRTHDTFVGGEIRAVITGLNGGRARPGGRRNLPHEVGIAGTSTFASNVETFAQIALLTGMGVADYSRTGSVTEPGTSLLTLVGDVPQPGVIEVPHGTPLDLLVPGRGDAPVLIGGYHGTWVRGVGDLILDRALLRRIGAPLGAGVVARPYAGTCVLHEVAAVSRWLASESAGQCGPCFFGLPALARDVADLADGTSRAPEIARRLRQVRGRGACAHPDGSVQFISSALTALADDIEVHARHGSCGRPPSTVLPLPGGAR